MSPRCRAVPITILDVALAAVGLNGVHTYDVVAEPSISSIGVDDTVCVRYTDENGHRTHLRVCLSVLHAVGFQRLEFAAFWPALDSRQSPSVLALYLRIHCRWTRYDDCYIARAQLAQNAPWRESIPSAQSSRMRFRRPPLSTVAMHILELVAPDDPFTVGASETPMGVERNEPLAHSRDVDRQQWPQRERRAQPHGGD